MIGCRAIPARMRGMTLIEMVVALVILGMLAMLAMGGLRLGARTWEAVGGRAESESRERIVRLVLRRTLSQAMPVIAMDVNSQPHLVFSGDGDSVTLVAPLADHIGLGGLQMIRLSIEDGTDFGLNKRLVLYRMPYDRGEVPAQPVEPERHVLLEDLAAARFSYLEIAADGTRQWNEKTTEAPILPSVIRLSLRVRDSARLWPDIVVPLRITAGPIGP